jgi:hypothetical protein
VKYILVLRCVAITVSVSVASSRMRRRSYFVMVVCWMVRIYDCGVLFMSEIVGRARVSIFRILQLSRSWVSMSVVIDSASSKARHCIHVSMFGVSRLGAWPWVDLSLHLGWLHIRVDAFVVSSDRVAGLDVFCGVVGCGGGMRVWRADVSSLVWRRVLVIAFCISSGRLTRDLSRAVHVWNRCCLRVIGLLLFGGGGGS